jgi:F-box protein 9
MEENGNEEVVTENVLVEFRNQWRQELIGGLSDSEKSVEEEAKNLFLQGVDLEKRGKCFEAIRLYRRAVQLVPDIEFRAYATNPQKGQSDDSKNNNKNKSKSGTSSHFTESNSEIDNLVETFQNEFSLKNSGMCESTFGKGTISTSLHISCLPVEVFLLILKWIVSNDLDMRSIERFGRTCKGFFLLSRDSEVWKLACHKVWGSNVSPTSTWREMYMSRPRVNFNGCYISRITYQRYGENSFQDQFYRPVQLVEYFRLIRFLPSGKILMMTSADELQTSVNKLKNVQNAMQSREILKGEYHYQDSTVLIVIKKQQLTNSKFKLKYAAAESSLNFFLELEIDDTPKKKFTKLAWKHYAVSQFRNGDEMSTDYDLRSSTKYPPFYFSQVKSFHSESTDCLKV